MSRNYDITITDKRSKKQKPDSQKDPNWPYARGKRRAASFPGRFTFYDAFTEPDGDGGWQVIDGVSGTLSTQGTLTTSHEACHPSSQSDYHYYLRVDMSSYAIDPSVYTDEFGESAEDPWQRMALGSVEIDTDRDSDTNKRWDFTGKRHCFRLQLKTRIPEFGEGETIKSIEDEVTEYDLAPDLLKDEVEKFKYEAGETAESSAEYKKANRTSKKWYLAFREYGMKSLCHYVGATGVVPAMGVDYGVDWLEPDFSAYCQFDMSDTENYKITEEPEYSADEVDGKVVPFGNGSRVQLFLVPRRYAYWSTVNGYGESYVGDYDYFRFRVEALWYDRLPLDFNFAQPPIDEEGSSPSEEDIWILDGHWDAGVWPEYSYESFNVDWVGDETVDEAADNLTASSVYEGTSRMDTYDLFYGYNSIHMTSCSFEQHFIWWDDYYGDPYGDIRNEVLFPPSLSIGEGFMKPHREYPDKPEDWNPDLHQPFSDYIQTTDFWEKYNTEDGTSWPEWVDQRSGPDFWALLYGGMFAEDLVGIVQVKSKPYYIWRKTNEGDECFALRTMGTIFPEANLCLRPWCPRPDFEDCYNEPPVVFGGNDGLHWQDTVATDSWGERRARGAFGRIPELTKSCANGRCVYTPAPEGGAYVPPTTVLYVIYARTWGLTDLTGYTLIDCWLGSAYQIPEEER